MGHKVIIAVDMQNDFITGSLGTAEAQVIVSRIKEKLEAHNGAILFTQDTHIESEYFETQEGKNLPVPHCIFGTWGWDICDALKSFRNHTVSYGKETFGSRNLAVDLYNIEKISWLLGFSCWTEEDEIELCGLCTDICVISNALLIKAFLPEVKISVDAACCAGTTVENHQNALKAMKMCQINIINEEGKDSI